MFGYFDLMFPGAEQTTSKVVSHLKKRLDPTSLDLALTDYASSERMVSRGLFWEGMSTSSPAVFGSPLMITVSRCCSSKQIFISCTLTSLTHMSLLCLL